MQHLTNIHRRKRLEHVTTGAENITVFFFNRPNSFFSVLQIKFLHLAFYALYIRLSIKYHESVQKKIEPVFVVNSLPRWNLQWQQHIKLDGRILRCFLGNGAHLVW